MKTMPPLFEDNRGRLIFVVVLLALAQAAATAVAAFSTRDIFEMLSQQQIDSVLPYYRLLFAGTAIALLYCLHKRTAEIVGQSYVMRCRGELYTHLAKLSVIQLQEKRHGQLALRFVGDLSAIKNWIANGITQLISAVLIIPSAALVLWWLDPVLFQAAIIPIVVAIIILFTAEVFLKPLHEILRRQRGKLSAEMLERISIASYLNFMGRTSRDKKLLKERSQQILVSAARRSFAKASLRMVPDLACTLAGVLILWEALQQSLTAATVAGALAIIGILGSPLRQLASVWDRRCAWLVSREKYLNILATPTLVDSNKKISFNSGALTVALRYLRIENIKPINFTINAGEKVLIEGGSENERKQLLHLIAGLEDANYGQVYINDHAMADVRAAKISQRIHLLSMNTPILQGSIRRALTLGLSNRPSDKAIYERAQEYYLRNTINRLGGLDGRALEKGSNLSLGEIGRIHLFRCSFDKPDLLLIDDIDQYLDEPTQTLLIELIEKTSATVIANIAKNDDRIKFNKVLTLNEKHTPFHESLIN